MTSAPFENIPKELREIPHWISWRMVEGKKIPNARINDPNTWGEFEKVCSLPITKEGGIGFVFNGDGFGGVDLDGCRNPETGELTPWAQEVISKFQSYTEISPSAAGVKIFTKDAPKNLPKNQLHMPGEKINGKTPAIEAYSNGRYFAITGQRLPDSPTEIKSAPHAWLWLIEKLKASIPDTPQTGRNTALTSLAGAMRQKGMDYDTILVALRTENPKRFNPPLPDKEIQSIAKSVCKYAPNPQELGFALTDLGNAQRLKARHGNDLLYCYPWKSWLVWDGRRFKVDEDGEAIRRAKETALSILEEAKAAYATQSDKTKHILAHAMSSQEKRGLENMLWTAQSELPVRIEELDQHDHLLNLENGTLDLNSQTLNPHRREDRLTKLSPVNLDGTAKCERWLSFLDKVLGGDQELINFIQRAVGYSLTGSTEEQVFFLLHGEGANGKSTFIQTILALLGEYAKPTEFKTLLKRNDDSGEIRNDLAALVGVRFVSAVEVGEGKQLDETVVKQLTGGDTITARFLHKEFFEFRPRFKLWLAANSKPEIRGIDHAIWRRVLLIPFEVTILEAEKDKTLPEKLRAELPGILAWAVDGLKAWRIGGLKPPEKIIAATQEYKEEQDILADFLKAECEIGEGEDFFVTAAILTHAYERWAGGEAVKAKTLARLLKARGFKPGQKKLGKKNHKIWIGLRLSESLNQEEANPF